jgi:hypothetical protein
LETILTNKGKPGLIVDGFKYRMDKENKSFHLWRCVKRSYNARSKTDVNDLMIIDNQRMDHSHEPDQERTLQRQKLRQECKKRALEERTERPKKEIITELRKKEKTETDKLLPEEVSSVRQREEEKDWVKENVCKQEEKDNTKTLKKILEFERRK